MLEKILWILALVSFVSPWMWPLSFVIILNISDLIKRIRGKSIDDETWLDQFNERLYIDGKISLVACAWPYFTFPVLTCLSIYRIFTPIIMAGKVMFFMLFLFFFFTEIYLLVKELSFKKTTQQ